MSENVDYRMILLRMIKSMLLADHIGDVSNDVFGVLKDIGMEPPSGHDEWGFSGKGSLGEWLTEQGVKCGWED